MAPVAVVDFQTNVNDSQADFNSDTALAGLGTWIEDNDERFFRPNIPPEEVDWQPYQHGHWLYDTKHSWTWKSYDLWGEVTDHYGVWRHHPKYKWVWVELPEHVYHPHCVTWFDHGDYIGWYPYYPDAPQIYARGVDAGFDDGFWLGVHVGAQINQPGFVFSIGVTLVTRSQVTVDNIYGHHERDPRLVSKMVWQAHSDDRIRTHRVGVVPGGVPAHAFAFVQGQSKVTAPVTHLHLEKTADGKHILAPQVTQDVPTTEKKRFANMPATPGAAPAADQGLHPQVTPPTPKIKLPDKVEPKPTPHEEPPKRQVKPEPVKPPAPAPKAPAVTLAPKPTAPAPAPTPAPKTPALIKASPAAQPEVPKPAPLKREPPKPLPKDNSVSGRPAPPQAADPATRMTSATPATPKAGAANSDRAIAHPTATNTETHVKSDADAFGKGRSTSGSTESGTGGPGNTNGANVKRPLSGPDPTRKG